MKDTSERFEVMVAERHRRMTSEQRLRAAAAMFDAGRAIVDASLPAELEGVERRLAIARRLYGDCLPDAALAAFASWSPASRGTLPRGESSNPLDPRHRGEDDQEDWKYGLESR